MRKLLRHRLRFSMIAIVAIVLNLLAPQAFSQMPSPGGAMPAMEMCHAGAGGQPAPDDAPQQHACCKVCVCHPAAAGLAPPPAISAPLFAACVVQHPLTPVCPAAGALRTKSSPRGPPWFA